LVIYVTVTPADTVFRMILSSMVVSRDWQEVSVLECILGSLQMNVAVEQEPQQALDRLSRSKVDALIVDCDLNGSSQLLRELQVRDKQANSVPLVLMGSAGCARTLNDTGALFAFEKPISVEQAVRTLSAARNLIFDGRLRYHRSDVEVPVALKCKGQKSQHAVLVNLSQGGMQIRTGSFVDAAEALQVSFALPGSKSGVRAQAEIVWQDQQGNLGVRFRKVAAPQQKTLQLWLAQKFLAN
jgi:FixJ family two-component response regulator